MTSIFSRTERLIGKTAMQHLAASRVAVFGIGGVGGHTAEALVRSGIGAIDLIDNDKVWPIQPEPPDFRHTRCHRAIQD